MLGRLIDALLISALLLGLFLSGVTLARAQTLPAEAAQLVETLGKEAAGILSSDKIATPDKRKTALKNLIRRGFNLELTSQFVLGKHWNRTSPEQRVEFQDLFTQYLVNSYAQHLGNYRAETLTVVASHPVGKKDVLVETSIDGDNGATSPVWRVRAVEGQYKIIDVSVDGVSLALTQRREFASVINQHGVGGLLKLLREKLLEQAKAVRVEPWRDQSHVSLLAGILASPNANKIGISLARR